PAGQGLAAGRPGLTVRHGGAGRWSRAWPSEPLASVAGALEAGGHRVVLTGSLPERAISANIRAVAGLSPDRDLAGRTDVPALTAMIAQARLVLSTDTGPAHLASAFRRPAVTLFGPVSPQWWGPPPGNPLHACIWKG